MISEEFGKRVILTQKTNRDLLGGFIVRIGDWLFDATLETELSQFQARLAGSSQLDQLSRFLAPRELEAP